MGFFSELHDDLVQVKKKIAQADESMLSEQEREQYELITVVASSMIDYPALWEEQCLFNIHYIGENFKSLIKNFLLDFSKNIRYNGCIFRVNLGVWRSWLARAVWDREVEGSSPFTPTIEII